MSRVYLFPISVFVLFQTTFICTYIAAILEGHVVPDIPYISDAATYSPESCVFGQLINIGCVLLGIVIYIRYRQIERLTIHHPNLLLTIAKWNDVGFWFGMGSCLGISIVANFQETNVRIVHFIGAFTCFGSGTIYFWIQALISYSVQEYVATPLIVKLRLGFSVLCTIFFFVAAVCGIISHILFEGNDARKWYPSDGGWKYHVASSISEWIVSSIFSFFILTFSDEFRDIYFDHPSITLEGYDVIEHHHEVEVDA